MNERRLLIVDDDEESRLMLSQLFSYYFDCETFLAEGTRAARDHLRDREIDLIVCDVHMPEESGLDFARSLSNEGSRTPLVFYTSADLTVRELLHAGGVFPFFQKPNLKDLLLGIEGLMGWTRRSREGGQ